MNQDWTKTIEKWLLRLVIIQFCVLLIGQILMSKPAWTPYLNRAIQDEGVIKTKQTETVKTMEEPPAVWYDNNKEGQ